MLCVVRESVQDNKDVKTPDDSYLYATVQKADKTIPVNSEMKGSVLYTSLVFDSDGSNTEKSEWMIKNNSATYATVGFDNNNKPVIKNSKRGVNTLSDIKEIDDSNLYESFINVAKKNSKNGKAKVTPMAANKFIKSGSFDEEAELPPTPPEEWETSGDRLGGKLYVAVKNFKARFPYEINVKTGELVELTEIDPEDKSWHVRVTLGTSLDGFTYTKRVGWVPYDMFTEYDGPDRRNDRSLSDVSQDDTCPLPGTDTCNDRSLSDVSENDTCPLPGTDTCNDRSLSDISEDGTCPLPGTDTCNDHVRLSRSKSDGVPETCDILAELDMTGKSSSVHDTQSTGGSNLQRRTGSWLGGSDVHHHFGHRFKASSLHVPIKCSYCKKWCSFQNQDVCEYQCLNCKLVVHKGCHVKIINRCRLDSTPEEAYCPVSNKGNERLCIDLPHRFLVHTWKVPPRCIHCSSFIIGMVRQGLKCAECGANLHHKCKPNVANTCSTKYKEIADQLYEVKA